MDFEERYTYERLGIEAHHDGYSCVGAVIMALAFAGRAVSSEQHQAISRGFNAVEQIIRDGGYERVERELKAAQ